MDKIALDEIDEILTGFKENPELIDETKSSLIDVFYRYRLRSFKAEKARREIEATLKEQKYSTIEIN